MKNLLGWALAAFALIAMPIAASAAVITAPLGRYAPGLVLIGINSATAAYTNATTSYTDITGTSIEIPATRGDYSLQFVRVCWAATATKATSTTGTVRVYANGAGIAASAKTVTFGAANDSLGGCYTVARSSGAAQTVKLQGVSGDTAALTVANAQIEVYIIQTLS